jgi:hypothetical protein
MIDSKINGQELPPYLRKSRYSALQASTCKEEKSIANEKEETAAGQKKE